MSVKKILIVDDDVAVSGVYAKTLRSAGHEVTVCNRFEDARAELKRAVPDAVLTDIRLGEYNGLQLAILFRSILPAGIVVAVSGHADPVIQQEVAQLKASFFVKPVGLDMLQRAFL